MSEAAASPLPADPMAASAARWLASQPEGNVAIAREILRRRAALRSPGRKADEWSDVHQSGVIDGMLRALAMLGDRPGDISRTGAGGFVDSVGMADQLVAKAAAEEEAR